MPAIETNYQINFDTLIESARAGEVLLLDCQDKATGKPVRVICAVNKVGDTYDLVPLAKLFDGNPYSEVNPPDVGGGYVG